MSSQSKVCLSQMYSWQKSDIMTDTSWLFILSYLLMLNFFLGFRLEGLYCNKSIQQCMACIARVIVHIFVTAE